MNSKKNLVLEKQISGNFHRASASNTSAFSDSRYQTSWSHSNKNTRWTYIEIRYPHKQMRTHGLTDARNNKSDCTFFYAHSIHFHAHRRQRTSGNLGVTRIHVPKKPLSITPWSNIAAIKHATFCGQQGTDLLHTKSFIFTRCSLQTVEKICFELYVKVYII